MKPYFLTIVPILILAGAALLGHHWRPTGRASWKLAKFHSPAGFCRVGLEDARRRFPGLTAKDSNEYYDLSPEYVLIRCEEVAKPSPSESIVYLADKKQFGSPSVTRLEFIRLTQTLPARIQRDGKEVTLYDGHEYGAEFKPLVPPLVFGSRGADAFAAYTGSEVKEGNETWFNLSAITLVEGRVYEIRLVSRRENPESLKSLTRGFVEAN